MSTTKQRYFIHGLIAAAGLLLYGFTLWFPFVFDDHIYLVQNPIFRDGRSFGFPWHFTEFANLSKNMGLDPDLSTNFILRPFTYLTFYLNYVLGGLKPPGYRIVNIIIHCANAVLLFQIVSHLLRISTKGGSLSTASMDFIALTAAMLFLVHPMQIESVTYIIQRFTSLGTFWYLFTIRAYFLSVSSGKGTSPALWRWTACTGLVIGMLSKEILFTAPLMLVIMDWVIVGTPLKNAFRRAVPFLCCLPIIPILLVLTSRAQSGGMELGSSLRVANPGGSVEYHYNYALTEPGVILTYLRLLLIPIGQNIDPDHHICTSALDWRFILPVAAIIAIIGGSTLWYRKRHQDLRSSLFFCSVIWFFLTLSIDSTIVPLPDVMAEHRSYLPSIGVALAAACFADWLRIRLRNRENLKHLGVSCTVLVVLLFSVATIVRNRVWSSEVSMWSDTSSKSPGKVRPLLNLGAAYIESGRLQEAVPCFKKAIKIDPTVTVAYANLVMAENSLGKYDEAIAAGLTGARFTPGPYDYDLFVNLGLAFNARGEIENSIKCFQASIAARPNFRLAHLGLAELYTKTKNYGEALNHYRIAASIAPLDPPTQQKAQELEGLIAQHAENEQTGAGQR